MKYDISIEKIGGETFEEYGSLTEKIYSVLKNVLQKKLARSIKNKSTVTLTERA